MNGQRVSEGTDRRQLLAHMLPAGAFACMLCRRAFAATAEQAKGGVPPPKPRPKEKCNMTYEELFNFAYVYDFIPAMKAMGAEIGREKLAGLLSRAYSAAAVERVDEQLKANPKNDLATYTADLRNQNPLYQNTLAYTLVEDTPATVEARVTECLWAKVFREAGAADVGYACLCHPEFAAVPAFNPKIKLSFTKTLMQGHDCCNPRYVMQT